MNTELRKNTKNNFEKDFFKLMNNECFGKTMENISKHKGINFATAETKSKNYHTTKKISENLLAIEMKKTQIFMNKQVYLGLSMLILSKIVINEFSYD